MSGYMLSAYLLANRLIKETPIQPFHLLPEVICDGVKFTDVHCACREVPCQEG
jgi:hypothetical protein